MSMRQQIKSLRHMLRRPDVSPKVETDAVPEMNVRKPESMLPFDLVDSLQQGIMSYRYKGVPTLKCPFDLALYTDIFWEMKPATILEFGSNKGGSALWMADTLDAMGLSATKIFTLDIEFKHEFKDPRVNFIQCDINDIDASLPPEFMAKLPRPLLVIEDSGHQFHLVKNVLDFFHKYSSPQDYIVVEDGIISVMKMEEEYEGGPFQAIHAFLNEHPGAYEVDRQRCDFYGRNVTWNIDGYIRRIC